MAERRMFAKTIIDSDAFLDMPLSTQALYFHLSMRADDDGFINSPKKIQRTIGATDDDLRLLIAKNFIIPFESGVVVIKHWKIHNYIRSDRKHDTKYLEERSMLSVKENGSYTVMSDTCQSLGCQLVDKLDTEVRLGKDSIGKVNNNSGAKRFVKPTVDEIRTYCTERKNQVDPQIFYDFYEAKGWMVGKNHMKNWKAAVRTWETRKSGTRTRKKPNAFNNYDQRVYDDDFYEDLENNMR